MRDESQPAVLVVGLGKLGVCIAAVIAAAGFDVYGSDPDPDIRGTILRGNAPHPEPEVAEIIARHPFHVSADTAALAAMADVAYIVVPTPSLPDGRFDSSMVCDAVRDVARGFQNRVRLMRPTIVVVSTVMPGTIDGPVRDTLDAEGLTVDADVGLVYSPALIALGSVVRDLRNPDVVMIGASDALAGAVHESIIREVVKPSTPIRDMSPVDTEIAKLSINAYLSVKIAYANTVARVCEGFPGADAANVLATVGADTRIGSKFLTAGGTGSGPCLPRDTVAFDMVGGGAASGMVKIADGEVLDWIEEQVIRSVCPGFAHEVAVLGLAYKPGVPVVADSFGIRVLNRLRALFDVVSHDPMVSHRAQRVVEAPELTAALDASVWVVACPHDEYRLLLPVPGQTVIDVWGLYGAGPQIVRPGQG